MTDPTHPQILGHLFGALDDDEQHKLDARLEHDKDYCRELTRWRQRLAPLETMRPDFEPPPGLAERTCRCVAAWASAAAGSQTWGRRRRMSPHPVPPSHVGRVGWLDVAAVALLLMTAGAVVLPAIDSSRFEARLASCQDGLRQFGLALSQYGFDQRRELVRLANHGRLTRAGACAAALLRDGELADGGRSVCPDAWLAAQGVLRVFAPASTKTDNRQRPATAVAGVMARQSPDAQSGGVPGSDDPQNDWPGTWRNGTRDGWRIPPSPAGLPLLADAPSADLPGQDVSIHGGRGRNVLFADGRVDFLPLAASVDATDGFFSPGEITSTGRISAPIIFVSGR